MATKRNKKTKKTVRIPATLKTLARWIHGRGRPMVLAALVVVLVFGGWYVSWRRVCRGVLSSDQYHLTAKDLQITRLPPWIHSDVSGEVFRDVVLDGPVSIMNTGVNKRIADAFALHPWIARAHRVSKHHPARVKVELTYRRPVCMVEVPGGLRPVDIEGVSLPCGDFSPIEAARYPRLTGVDTVPVGPIGTRWGDERVVGGAEIAGTLGKVWDELGLVRIVPSKAHTSGHDEQYTYALFTRNGTKIIWGRAPGTKLPGEPPAAEKLARLKSYLKHHGTLNGADGPQQIDVSAKHSPGGPGRTAKRPKAPVQ